MKTYCPYPTSKKACAINYNGMCCLECPKYHDCEDACKNNPQDDPKGCGKNKCFYPGGVNSEGREKGRRDGMTELKPCPFCGEADDIDYGIYNGTMKGFDYVQCQKCGATINELHNGKYIAAEEAWNRRAGK